LRELRSLSVHGEEEVTRVVTIIYEHISLGFAVACRIRALQPARADTVTTP
jgi:hypothetical protein